MKRCVIVGGADIGDAALIRGRLRVDDFFVFCDGGLAHREALQADPDLIVGDFDSAPVPEGDIYRRKFESFMRILRGLGLDELTDRMNVVNVKR